MQAIRHAKLWITSLFVVYLLIQVSAIFRDAVLILQKGTRVFYILLITIKEIMTVYSDQFRNKKIIKVYPYIN